MKALQIPVTLYIHVTTYPLPEDIRITTVDMSHYSGFVLMETRQIMVDVEKPEPIDIIGKQVEALRAQKDHIAAESHRQQRQIEDQIQQLLCIDHVPVDTDEIPF